MPAEHAVAAPEEALQEPDLVVNLRVDCVQTAQRNVCAGLLGPGI
jgi:hypothetical protein